MNLPLAPTKTPRKDGSWSRGEVALLIAPFALLWAVYFGLRTTMPGDALTPFRNGLYWPDSGDVMLAKGGGVLSRVLLHLGFTYGLGLLLLIGFVVIQSVVSKRDGQSHVGVLLCFALAFLLMLGVVTVPNRHTRIDPERERIVVTHMIPVPPWNMSEEKLATKDVRAIGARLGVRGTKWKERVVRLYALPAKGEPLELGEAECPGGVPEGQGGHRPPPAMGPDEECLTWADPAAALLAKKLGWKGKPRTSMQDGDKLRQWEPATRQ